MLIVKIGPWRVFSKTIISAEEVGTLKNLSALQKKMEDEQRAARSRIAQRARRLKRHAYNTGLALGNRTALENAGKTLGASLQAWKQMDDHIARTVFNGIEAILDILPKSVLLESQIKKCIAAARSHPLLRLRISEDNAAYVVEVIKDIEQQTDCKIFEVLIDSNLPPRSCLMETEDGIIDGGITQQIDVVRNAILSAMRAGETSLPKDDVGC